MAQNDRETHGTNVGLDPYEYNEIQSHEIDSRDYEWIKN